MHCVSLVALLPLLAAKAQSGSEELAAPAGAEDPAVVGSRAASDAGARERFLKELAGSGIAVDPKAGRVEVDATINHPRMPVEYLLAGTRGATHECLFVSRARPSLLAAAIHFLGVTRGKNVRYLERNPPPTEAEMESGVSPYETLPPEGDGLYLYVEWKEGDEIRQYRAEDLMTSARTGRSLPRHRWVFLGSRFVRPTKDDPEVFAADAEENLIAVTYFAVGNQLLTYPDPEAATQNVFFPNAALLPEAGSPVRIVLSRQRLERPYSSR